MAKWVYEALCIMFGGSMAVSMASWMNTLFAAIKGLIANNLVSISMAVFSAIACSMLILYFFMDLTNQASRDLFSFEKLIVSFIRFLAAFVVLLCLKDILTQVVNVGEALYKLFLDDTSNLHRVLTSSSDSLELFPSISRSDYNTMPTWAQAEDKFKDLYDGIMSFLKNFGVLFICTIINVIGMVAKIAGYFICTSNAVTIIVKIVLAPLAVVQLFEDGTRSAGMRYLKGFVADCMTMAVIVLILLACSALTNGMISSMVTVGSGRLTKITFDNLSDVLAIGNIAIVLVPQLAAVGAMASGSRVAHEVMGA